MKIHNIGIRFLAASLVSTLLICSCRKDEPITVDKEAATSGIVTFDITQKGTWAPDIIGGAEEPQTRSGQVCSEQFLMDCQGDSEALPEEIYIYMIEEDIPEEVIDFTPQTKTDDDDSTPQTLYGIYAFLGTGSASDPSDEDISTFMDNLELYDNGKYSGGDKYWPGNGYWLQFYAYSPYMSTSSTAANYITKNSNSLEIHHKVSNDVNKHLDIMVGKSDKIDGSHASTVSMEVSHILSKVQVKVGTVSCGTIKSLKISGIKDSGTYSFANDSWADVKVSDGNIADINYQQNFNQAQSNNTPLGEPMYLIPQGLTEDAEIEIVVEVNFTPTTPSDSPRTTTYTLSKNLKQFIDQWQQDKQYTFVISTPHEVEVEVTDNVDWDGDYPVKKDLVIKNTGLAEAYIRVAVTGAWMVDDNTSGTVKKLTVSDWKTTDGVYTWPSAGEPTTGATNANNWRLGSDGYYYYMKKTSPGQTLGKLFESYKLTAPSPMLGAYLELSILAQAFYLTDAKHVFPSEIIDNLDK